MCRNVKCWKNSEEKKFEASKKWFFYDKLSDVGGSWKEERKHLLNLLHSRAKNLLNLAEIQVQYWPNICNSNIDFQTRNEKKN